MDYTQNLGYCKDTEHHYYETAKAAFNILNDHQRSLFTGNEAYSLEWERLSTWASINGDHLDSNNKLVNTANVINAINNTANNEAVLVILIISIFLILPPPPSSSRLSNEKRSINEESIDEKKNTKEKNNKKANIVKINFLFLLSLEKMKKRQKHEPAISATSAALEPKVITNKIERRNPIKEKIFSTTFLLQIRKANNTVPHCVISIAILFALGPSSSPPGI